MAKRYYADREVAVVVRGLKELATAYYATSGMSLRGVHRDAVLEACLSFITSKPATLKFDESYLVPGRLNPPKKMQIARLVVGRCPLCGHGGITTPSRDHAANCPMFGYMRDEDDDEPEINEATTVG